MRNLAFLRLVFCTVFCVAARAEPNFSAHAFRSTLPAKVSWELKQQFDDPAHDMVMRNYVAAEGARSITLLLGKNNTPQKDLASFTEHYKKGLAKPVIKLTSDKPETLGGIPARIILAEVSLPTGLRHLTAVLAVRDETIYTVTLTSDLKPVEEDEILQAFLHSVKIGPTEGK